MEREDVLKILKKLIGCNDLDPVECIARDCESCEFAHTEKDIREAVKFAYEYMKDGEK